MLKYLRYLVITIALIVGASALAGCDGRQSAAQQANEARTQGVNEIRANQPVHPMQYSPTLNTINRWADTWGQRGAVSYVYMKRADGSFDGYYVIDGLPVSYCVGGSPPYEMQDLPGDEDSADKQVPAPGLDAAYYGGCNSSRYYGFDAVTGQYIEYTDGMVLTAVLSNQPLPQQTVGGAKPYISSAQDVKKNQ